MDLTTNGQIKKALVSLAIEQTLIEIGVAVLDQVTKKLYEQYHCYLPDCYEKPEYLKAVLRDLFGASHVNIIESITKQLEEFASQKPIFEFLQTINSK